jgi:hypothetical protein
MTIDDNMAEHADSDKLAWVTPELIDLDTDLATVAGPTGGLNDGVVEALS